MRFKLKDNIELERAADYLAKLAGREATVDIKRVSYKRSLNQNSYLHLVLSYFGVQSGYTLSESKRIYKELNSDIYQYRKADRTFYKSSADLTTAEMAKSVDRFIQWSAEQGIDLPSAEDKNFIEWAQQQIANSGSYL